MAAGSNLLTVRVEVSDVDQGAYHSLSLRTAQHPSENASRVVARVLAYCFGYEEGLRFGRGLDEPEDPALSVTDATGRIAHWIDVGHPGADRLHRASKACERVTVLCHLGTEGLVRERDKRAIFRADRIAVWVVSPELVEAAAARLESRSDWALVRTGEDLMLSVAGDTLTGTWRTTTLAAL